MAMSKVFKICENKMNYDVYVISLVLSLAISGFRSRTYLSLLLRSDLTNLIYLSALKSSLPIMNLKHLMRVNSLAYFQEENISARGTRVTNSNKNGPLSLIKAILDNLYSTPPIPQSFPSSSTSPV